MTDNQSTKGFIRKDEKYLYGLCEVSAEVNEGNDKGLTNEFISHMAGVFNIKTMRVWLRLDKTFKCGLGDEITVVEDMIKRLRKYIDMLKKSGVERFLILAWSYVYPMDYVPTGLLTVPCPKTELSYYLRFLSIQEKCFQILAEKFPDVEYFEPANEPDIETASFFHKNGYKLNATLENNKPYIYKGKDLAQTVADLSWYVNRGIKRANDKATLVLPSFCNYDSAPDYLDSIYNLIESGELPTGDKKDKNVDNYFQILNWHPYSLKNAELDEEWIEGQKKIYAVAVKHGDVNKPVWYTEIGWSDFAREEEQRIIPKKFVKFFDIIKSELKFVETAFMFRLTTLADRKESEGEDNFGFVYNIYDDKHSGQPKQVALTMAKYIRGEDFDCSPLYRFVGKK